LPPLGVPGFIFATKHFSFERGGGKAMMPNHETLWRENGIPFD
jgi:hypothetical protein